MTETNVTAADGVKLTAEELARGYAGITGTLHFSQGSVERILAARLAEVTREQDTAKENVRRLRFQVEIRDDEIDALNGQRDEALAVVEAVRAFEEAARALADEWEAEARDPVWHAFIAQSYNSCAGQLRALVPAAPTSTRDAAEEHQR